MYFSAFPFEKTFDALVAGPSVQAESTSYSTFEMAKRKPARFSATKAVKANARERVGQPKPVRVVKTEPRTGRKVKHKPKLEEILRHDE